MRPKPILLLAFFLLVFGVTICHSWQIPNTGQSTCCNNFAEIVCPQLGESFCGHAGKRTINPLSYTKLDESDNELSDEAASWTMCATM